MKRIKSLIRTVRDWMEKGELLAELENIKRYGHYYELRKPRIVKRLVELGHPVHASDLPSKFADRHPQLAEDMRQLQENFEAEGLTGQWKGKA